MKQEIQRVNAVGQQAWLEKCPKIHEDSIILVIMFHPALCIIFDILIFAHQIVENPLKLRGILPNPPCVAFQNPKTLHNSVLARAI